MAFGFKPKKSYEEHMLDDAMWYHWYQEPDKAHAVLSRLAFRIIKRDEELERLSALVAKQDSNIKSIKETEIVEN